MFFFRNFVSHKADNGIDTFRQVMEVYIIISDNI